MYLKVYIYDFKILNQSDQYSETKKEIKIYFRITYNNGKDIKHVVLYLEKPEIPEAEDLPNDPNYFQK